VKRILKVEENEKEEMRMKGRRGRKTGRRRGAMY
jgi:hypothetical protein